MGARGVYVVDRCLSDGPIHPPPRTTTANNQQVQANIFPFYFSGTTILILASLGAWAHLEVRAYLVDVRSHAPALLCTHASIVHLNPPAHHTFTTPHHTQDNDKLKLTDPTVAVLLVAALLQAVQLLALGPMVNEAMRKRNRKEKEEGFADVSRWAVLDGIVVALS